MTVWIILKLIVIGRSREFFEEAGVSSWLIIYTERRNYNRLVSALAALFELEILQKMPVRMVIRQSIVLRTSTILSRQSKQSRDRLRIEKAFFLFVIFET